MNGVIPDIPRINTAIAEWLACLIIVLASRKRFNRLQTGLISFACLGVMIVFHYIADVMPLYLWVPSMVTAALLMLGMNLWLCRFGIRDGIVITVRCFILAEFAASLDIQLQYFFNNNQVFAFFSAPVTMLVFNYAVIYSIAFHIERRYRRVPSIHSPSKREAVFTPVIGALIFFLSNMSFVSRNTPLSGTLASDVFMVRTLIDLCGLVMLYTLQEQRLWMYARLEVSAMQNMLNRHHEQFRFSEENIKFLNHRFHDFKHQIAALRAEENPEQRDIYLKQMEDALRHFEMQFNTGNKVLDILLAGKSKQIVEQQINFTCVADGALLEGMDILDLCSIFGNALDNAFEGVTQLNDPERRIVQTTVFAQNDFLVLRFENYFEQSLHYEDGNIATTKTDKRSHGFGIKSIRKAVSKYGGNLQISAQDNWFVLCVLIPLSALKPQEKPQQFLDQPGGIPIGGARND